MFKKIKANIYRHILYHKLGQLWIWRVRQQQSEGILKSMSKYSFLQGGKTHATGIVFTYHLLAADKAHKKGLILTKYIEAKYIYLTRTDRERIESCLLSTLGEKTL